jgi:hypothetical protein
MRALAALCVMASVWSTACEATRGDPVNARPAPAAKSTASRDAARERENLHQSLMPWLTRRDELPQPLSETKCPDQHLAAAESDDAERTLVLRVEDSRRERKSPLALLLVRPLMSLDLGALESATLGDGPRLEPRTVERVTWLGSRRWVGTFHVTEFQRPHWIHRLGRAHPEWISGCLVSWLVVHDAKSGAPLCATRITVRNDLDGVPVSARSRSEVGSRLIEALGKATREQARTALGKISSVLRLEAAPAG